MLERNLQQLSEDELIRHLVLGKPQSDEARVAEAWRIVSRAAFEPGLADDPSTDVLYGVARATIRGEVRRIAGMAPADEVVCELRRRSSAWLGRDLSARPRV